MLQGEKNRLTALRREDATDLEKSLNLYKSFLLWIWFSKLKYSKGRNKRKVKVKLKYQSKRVFTLLQYTFTWNKVSKKSFKHPSFVGPLGEVSASVGKWHSRNGAAAWNTETLCTVQGIKMRSLTVAFRKLIGSWGWRDWGRKIAFLRDRTVRSRVSTNIVELSSRAELQTPLFCPPDWRCGSH